MTKEEFVRLLNEIKNQKHQLIIKLIYSAGLRVSEALNLKVKDLELDKSYGWVREGKGRKDRLFIIAENLKEELIRFIKNNDLSGESSGESILFKNQKGFSLSANTIRLIVKHAAKKAKLMKNIHPHSLRHSFATHLIENGYGITSVQSLLGHNSPQTTMVYLHMASPKLLSVKSPFDSLHFND